MGELEFHASLFLDPAYGVVRFIDQDRRQLLSGAALGIAAAGAASIFPIHPVLGAANDEIRPFRINFPEQALMDLRRRVSAS
jgi:hypothetical protein